MFTSEKVSLNSYWSVGEFFSLLESCARWDNLSCIRSNLFALEFLVVNVLRTSFRAQRVFT